MYSERAAALRRCTATTRAGASCRGWALWDGSGRCVAHSPRQHRGPQAFVWDAAWGCYRRAASLRERSRVPACHCAAYPWPHRRGGGLCRWPDPPDRTSAVPLGTRSWRGEAQQEWRRRQRRGRIRIRL